MSQFLLDATSLAARIRQGEISAVAAMRATLDRIDALDPCLHCFTTLLANQALVEAERVDAAIALRATKSFATGKPPGLLAGVPFAVKDLYDIAGVTTLAGSKINAERAPATQDATLVTRLKQAGAILVGALNMDEYAYGFVTENSHYGTTHNPHDLSRMAGGSSGGSAAAVTAGLVPFSLGSDTNGSIRVPAAFCGIFGLKPTYGRLSRAGAYPFVASLDHAGLFARSGRDLALIYDLLQGHDQRDPVCTTRLPESCLSELTNGVGKLRIAIADDYFLQAAEPLVLKALEQVAAALGVTQRVTLPEAERARAAAFIITASEGSNLHLANLRQRPQDFDPATRDRFLAGALIPASWYLQAQRFRAWWRDRCRELFQQVDIILAPTTPCVAPNLGQQTITLAGAEVALRPNLGLYTQPLSLIGLPVISVPVQTLGQMPVGIQIIAAPYNEAAILRVAVWLEAQGIVSAPIPHLPTYPS